MENLKNPKFAVISETNDENTKILKSQNFQTFEKHKFALISEAVTTFLKILKKSKF